ncbi:hypothetical protein [Gracilibacillus kekensis]|uniref:Uncharacterized protein n=1 Tax=Gracilibacillus kekensis TaxID=1027249 RepID=A0A1M7P3E4_9BACI|nr:hypothetical protein [Gracilibacillus kekensis]SHN10718.1 hypothetical protein SAMN05216179_1926 [Gracilibacillus kekensis]
MAEKPSEFNSFKKWTPQDGTHENKISILLFVIGWGLVFICILLSLFVVMNNINFMPLLLAAGAGIIAGVVLIAIAEIIKLLTSINDQLKKKR